MNLGKEGLPRVVIFCFKIGLNKSELKKVDLDRLICNQNIGKSKLTLLNNGISNTTSFHLQISREQENFE